MGKIFDFIDGQFRISKFHKYFLRRKVPEDIGYSYCFGGIALVYFLVLALTGLFLSMYYVPSEKEAYKSVVMITDEVFGGWLVRSVHKWASSLFIISIIFHTIRVFISKSYMPPRQLNWVVGCFSFIVAMTSGFTGYLLPWDQKAYWATEVGTSMIKTIPFIGEYLLQIVRGGSEITGITLIRFYSLHTIFLPYSIVILMLIHFHIVKKLGISRNL